MYAKIIDRYTIQRFKPPIKAEGQDIYTNDPAILLEYGWKELITSTPEQREGYYPKAYYTETETQINQNWEYIPIEEENNV